jgi:hypothetical protein
MDGNLNAGDPALARRYGSMVAIVAGVAGALYAVALVRRSYWAVAVPVTVVVAALSGAGIVLGRVLMTTPDEPPDPE